MSDQHYVEVQFTSEGQKKFAEATGAVAARTDGTNQLYIVMDKQIISAPSVSEKIDNDSCVITGSPATARPSWQTSSTQVRSRSRSSR